MSKYTEDKNYIYYENTDIPVNKLGIKNREQLELKERELLLKGYQYFHETLTSKTNFDEQYFISLHKKTFGELYDFAGKYRNVNISKGHSVFCQARFLKETSTRIFNELKKDGYLKNYYDKPKEIFARKIAYYMCELIALHPFYELNGRIIRLFFDMIAIYNGYEYIDYRKTINEENENDENEFVKASIECMIGNEEAMFGIVFNGLKKSND